MYFIVRQILPFSRRPMPNVVATIAVVETKLSIIAVVRVSAADIAFARAVTFCARNVARMARRRRTRDRRETGDAFARDQFTKPIKRR